MGRVLLAGGGTAGHVTPALAVAAALQAAQPGLEVEFVGTAAGLESRLVPSAGFRLHHVPAAPFRREVSLDTLRLPFVVWGAARRARHLLVEREAAVACVFGGYVSGPLALAARLEGIPLVLHEQNAVPGLANRIASRWATAVAVSVATARHRFPYAERVEVTGNPVRADLAGADLTGLRGEALESFGLRRGRPTLLVFGGSLGAARLNDAVLDAAPRWGDPEAIQVLHVTGQRDHERVAAAWEASSAGVHAVCVAFVERMELAYAAADVVLCRSGASTVAELAVAGLPGVLVPYPHGAADEQAANARALSERGGALLVPDSDLDGARLVAEVQPLLADPQRLSTMAAAARSVGRPDAADRLARLILDAAANGLPGSRASVREDGPP